MPAPTPRAQQRYNIPVLCTPGRPQYFTRVLNALNALYSTRPPKSCTYTRHARSSFKHIIIRYRQIAVYPPKTFSPCYSTNLRATADTTIPAAYGTGTGLFGGGGGRMRILIYIWRECTL